VSDDRQNDALPTHRDALRPIAEWTPIEFAIAIEYEATEQRATSMRSTNHGVHRQTVHVAEKLEKE
jgi:hypothetical protein